MSDSFQNWFPLKTASLSSFPTRGEGAMVYAIRDSRDGEILKYGKTQCARVRIFRNYIGGAGGQTTQRIHDNLLSDGMIEHVEIAWIETLSGTEAELQEKRFRANFVKGARTPADLGPERLASKARAVRCPSPPRPKIARSQSSTSGSRRTPTARPAGVFWDLRGKYESSNAAIRLCNSDPREQGIL
jgi:hypothetical protein